jgi:acyl homoserine lactone synthase
MITVHMGSTLPSELRDALLRYRYDVFVRHLGWKLPLSDPGHETDEFDGPDTVYLIDRDAQRQVRGCARLLPTIRPYLLAKHFGHLLAGATPHSHEVWELSRLAVGQTSEAASSIDKSTSLKGLLNAALNFAKNQGARSLIGVTFPALTRRFAKLGACVEQTGFEEHDSEGHAIIACEMQIDASLQGMAALDESARSSRQQAFQHIAFGKDLPRHQHRIGRSRKPRVQRRLQNDLGDFFGRAAHIQRAIDVHA